MKKLALLAILLLSSCAHREVSKVQDIKTPEGVPYSHHLGGVNSQKLLKKNDSKVKLVEVVKDNFNQEQSERAAKYIPIMNRTLESDCFEEFMLGRELIQTQKRTRQEVVDHIRSTTAKVELVSYYKRFSSAVGYTYPNTNKIWQNWRVQQNFSYCRAASNLAHEASHKLGYGHDYKRTARRPYSVPYSINAAFNLCCSNTPVSELPSYEPDPEGVTNRIKVCWRSWKTLWLIQYCRWEDAE